MNAPGQSNENFRPLAAYAVSEAATRGRIHREASPKFRSEFQRDRDRVIHCSAFRRLEYKTQVFVNHEGDMFRTRLTHSLEVAQVARTIARALAVNEDLTEAISLAHDLGHTPFGHAGQTALNRCMRQFGGFEHNLQSLRVVEKLEQRYGAFDGLNLLFETREGILKHCSVHHARLLGPLGERFLKGLQPSMEAQIANVADEIAYNHHDIDDGLRSGILQLSQLREHALFNRVYEHSVGKYPGLEERRLFNIVLRQMFGLFVDDLITTTRQKVCELQVSAPEEVKASPTPLVVMSDTMRSEHLALKRILRRKLYHDSRVESFAQRAQQVVHRLFEYMRDNPKELPREHEARVADDNQRQVRVIADYIAGMTDRYAISEHQRLFGTGFDDTAKWSATL